MATNSGNINGNSSAAYFHSHHHHHNAARLGHVYNAHNANGGNTPLPPASELLSPSPNSYASSGKLQASRHPLQQHSSVASSPSMAPPSPYLLSGGGSATPTSYQQPLTEPGTPATFLNPSSVDPVCLQLILLLVVIDDLQFDCL